MADVRDYSPFGAAYYLVIAGSSRDHEHHPVEYQVDYFRKSDTTGGVAVDPGIGEKDPSRVRKEAKSELKGLKRGLSSGVLIGVGGAIVCGALLLLVANRKRKDASTTVPIRVNVVSPTVPSVGGRRRSSSGGVAPAIEGRSSFTFSHGRQSFQIEMNFINGEQNPDLAPGIHPGGPNEALPVARNLNEGGGDGIVSGVPVAARALPIAGGGGQLPPLASAAAAVGLTPEAVRAKTVQALESYAAQAQGGGAATRPRTNSMENVRGARPAAAARLPGLRPVLPPIQRTTAAAAAADDDFNPRSSDQVALR